MTKQRLEQRLIVLDWLYSQLGFDFARLQELLRGCGAGNAASGLSQYADTLAHQTGALKLPLGDLTRYDTNIRTAMTQINHTRATALELKYYQYIAALLVELLLDRRQKRATLLSDLNDYVIERNRQLASVEAFGRFVDADLDKVAVWMATGSGKTLLLHLNYRQYLRANSLPQNIILITPNEGLSAQHLAEFAASGIPAERWRGSASGPLRDPKTVVIIEITKLSTAGGRGGISASVGNWSKPNLVFVDEGHRGSGGDVWKNVRDTLGAGGFTFEYSATFGQAVHAVSGKTKTALLHEYSQAIIFDYSYKYFYNDNYGKDYSIFNLPGGWDNRLNERMLVANLLQFYQQRRAFDDHRAVLAPYNVELPLWIFVGSSVNAVSKGVAGNSSDMLDALLFLERVLNNPTATIATIATVLAGRSELRIDGFDIFAGRFSNLGSDAAAIYADLLQRIFHTQQSTTLRLINRSNADGEIALHAGSNDQPFGVINIGDTRTFLDLVANRAPFIVQSVDRFGGSLFSAINRAQSPINILLGAKKFIEGWNSWRVSTMTLLNVGKSEGAQIIQLFGRGVRLRGQNHSLQRSAANAPPAIAGPLQHLETLAVFGLQANYMDTFAEYLQRENTTIEPLHELIVPIEPHHVATFSTLVVPTLDSSVVFEATQRLDLSHDTSRAPITLKVSQMLQATSSRREQVSGVATTIQEFTLPSATLAMLDWTQLEAHAQAHKHERGYTNLHIQPAALQAVLGSATAYQLIGNPASVRVATPSDTGRVQALAQQIMLGYIERFYDQHRLRWEGQHLRYVTLQSLPDVLPTQQSIVVRASQRRFLQDLETLIASQALYTSQPANIPTLYLAEHLYQPVFTEGSAAIEKAVPVVLGASEQRFMADLKTFLASVSLPADWQLLILRNQSKGKGVYFWQNAGFYPDFIVWLLTPSKQHIIFIDPKGLRNLLGQFNDEKVTLHRRIKDIETQLQPTIPTTIQLDSFLDSTTSMPELRWHVQYASNPPREATLTDYHASHVFFQSEGPGRFRAMFARIGITL